MALSSEVTIGERQLGRADDTYIIAEIGSNFDKSKDRAKKLINLAAECGADAAKFQAFEAESIVSQYGFDGLKSGFQSDWDKPVYEVYSDAELPREWIDDLVAHCERKGLDFLCTPYDHAAIDQLADVDTPAFKIGSGDITWHELLEHVAECHKPIILATGASTLGEIEDALKVIEAAGNEQVILLQCVTNYPSKFESANIRAMSTLAEIFDVPIGYSDHTPGSVVPLGAVSRGACVIEKHFTDDTSRNGPDHGFAMDPSAFKRMVDGIRNLNDALGDSRKRVYDEEETPIILQRRCLRADTDIEAGDTITEDDLVALRPAPEDAIEPPAKDTIVGRTATVDIPEGDHLTWQKV